MKERILLIEVFAVNIICIFLTIIILNSNDINPLFDKPNEDGIILNETNQNLIFIQFSLFWLQIPIILFFIIRQIIKLNKLSISDYKFKHFIYLILYIMNFILLFYVNSWSLEWILD